MRMIWDLSERKGATSQPGKQMKFANEEEK